MRIFIDRHHEGLFDSLVRLFETRLGHTVYYPLGMDWFPENWAIARPYGDSPDTAEQYLDGGTPSDGTPPLPARPGGVSFDQFTRNRFDVVVASYRDHIDIYDRLIKTHQPHAKLVAQYGNVWPWHDKIKNYLASVKEHVVPDGVNACFYHQEFDTDLFDYRPVNYRSRPYAASFVMALPHNDHLQRDWDDFLILERHAHLLAFYSHGGGCRDGALNYPHQVAAKMRDARFIIQLKNGGDGYGHNVHNALAVGRPIVYRSSQYKNTLAGDKLKHLHNGIDVDQEGIMETARLMSAMPDQYHQKMCENARATFEEIDFEREAIAVGKFLEKLQ